MAESETCEFKKSLAELKDGLVSIAELSGHLHLTTRAVEKQMAKLQREGRLRRIGPDKGGHWEVMP